MKSKDVDDYIAGAAPDRQDDLKALRALIHKAVPGIKETMQYNMPTFMTSDVVCALASQKQYMALYTCAPEVMDKYQKDMAHLNNGKGCIRFKKFDQLPLAAITRILKEMAKNPGFGHNKANR